MARLEVHRAGDRAPAMGHQEQLNISGTPTDWAVLVREGERLPTASRDFAWRRTEGCCLWRLPRRLRLRNALRY